MERSRRSSEPMLMEIVANIISALVIAPGHPQEGPFFLMKRLLNVLGECVLLPVSYTHLTLPTIYSV